MTAPVLLAQPSQPPEEVVQASVAKAALRSLKLRSRTLSTSSAIGRSKASTSPTDKPPPEATLRPAPATEMPAALARRVQGRMRAVSVNSAEVTDVDLSLPEAIDSLQSFSLESAGSGSLAGSPTLRSTWEESMSPSLLPGSPASASTSPSSVAPTLSPASPARRPPPTPSAPASTPLPPRTNSFNSTSQLPTSPAKGKAADDLQMLPRTSGIAGARLRRSTVEMTVEHDRSARPTDLSVSCSHLESVLPGARRKTRSMTSMPPSPDRAAAAGPATGTMEAAMAVGGVAGVKARIKTGRGGDLLKRLNRNLSTKGADGSEPSRTANDEAWLLKRQLEVELSLRTKLSTDADIDATRRTVGQIMFFFDELRRVADRLQVEQAVAFQDLLSHLAPPGASDSFDTQGGSGAIPMHQAKVLNRRQRLEGEVSLEEHLSAEYLEELLTPVRALRALIRVKMEDSNDLHMAEDVVRATSVFLGTLTRYARDKGITEFAALQNLRVM